MIMVLLLPSTALMMLLDIAEREKFHIIPLLDKVWGP